jgi:hypothetical protein
MYKWNSIRIYKVVIRQRRNNKKSNKDNDVYLSMIKVILLVFCNI